MVTPEATTITVRPAVSPAERQRALVLLFGEGASDVEARAADQASWRTSLSEGLWVAVHAEKVVSSLWLVPQPGATASLFPPPVSDAAIARAKPATSASVSPAGIGPVSAGQATLVSHGVSPTAVRNQAADLLLRTALPQLGAMASTAGVTRPRLIQSLLERGDDAGTALLRRHGFEHLTNLRYLTWLARPRAGANAAAATEASAALPNDSAWTLLPYDPGRDRSRLEELLQRTYVGTLDCPALDGLRSAGESLDGYLGDEPLGDNLFWILHHRGHDAGCLLLGDHAGDDQLEILYVGVTPEARGARGGEFAVRQAQALTTAHPRSRLVVSVDAKNAPAMRMYGRCGMIEWDERRVLVRREIFA